MNDMGKASQTGIPAYNAEQEQKRKFLDFLLSHYNDGRRKNLFCVAVNLLTIKEIENVVIPFSQPPQSPENGTAHSAK